MPFLVLDKSGHPLIDPMTGLIRDFETRAEAEAHRKAQRASRIMEIPSDPVLTSV